MKERKKHFGMKALSILLAICMLASTMGTSVALAAEGEPDENPVTAETGNAAEPADATNVGGTADKAEITDAVETTDAAEMTDVVEITDAVETAATMEAAETKAQTPDVPVENISQMEDQKEVTDKSADDTGEKPEDGKTEDTPGVTEQVKPEDKTENSPNSNPGGVISEEELDCAKDVPDHVLSDTVEEDSVKYSTLEEFDQAVASVGDMEDEASVRGALANCISIYNRLSEEDKGARAEEYAYIQSYAKDLGQSEIDPMALLVGEKFRIQVNVGYLDGNQFIKTSTTTVIGTCKDSNGHSGFNHSMNPNEILAAAGYPGSSYRVTSGSNWGSPASTTRVTYNITGSAPYKADQAFWIIGDKPTIDPGTSGGDGNGDGINDSGTVDITDGSRYVWRETLVYHANYPGGNDPQVTVTYNVRALSKLRGIDSKTFDACGFSLPDGYSLKSNSWYSISSGGSVKCNMGGIFSLSYDNRDKTTHLYAQYTPNEIPKNTFTMKYNANGGLVEGRSTHTVSITTTAASYQFHSFEASRDGYEFLGWYTSAYDDTKVTWPQTLDTSNSTKTVYAHWNKLDRHEDATVIYIPGEGTGNRRQEVVPGSQKYTIKSSANVGFTSPVGKVFSHWEYAGTQNKYFPGDEFMPADGSSNVFTAIWKNDDSQTGNATYKVQWFDKDGKSIKNEETRRGTAGWPVSVSEGDKLVSGYEFDSGDNRNLESAILAADHTTVLKLYFAKLPETKITVTWKDGYTDTPIKTEIIDKDGDYSKLYPADPTRDGYRFDKWSDPEIDEDGNITITAKWIKQITVTWYDDDGSTVLAGPIPFDQGETEPSYPNGVPTKVEDADYTYTFSGWDHAVDNEGNITYTAIYTAVPKVKQVTLTYDANGGITPPAQQTQDKGSAFTIEAQGTMTRDGYTFLGWSTDSTAETADPAYGAGVKVALDNNLTLFAIWNKNEENPDPTPGPTDPTDPTPGPTDPTPGPTDPTDPTPGPTDPTDPTPGPTDPTDPTQGHTDPTDPTPGPTDPTNPTPGPTDPMDPTDPTPGPTDPTDPTPGPADPAPTPGADPSLPADPAPTPAPAPTLTPAVAQTPVPAPAPAAYTPVEEEDETPLVEAEDEQVPLAVVETDAEDEAGDDVELQRLEDEEVPLAGGNGSAWALINFALMNLAIFESLMLMIGYFVKTKNDRDEEEKKLKKKGLFRILSVLVAVISLIAFILTEDITLPTGFVDKYTILMVIIAVVQTVLVALSNKKYQYEEEEA